MGSVRQIVEAIKRPAWTWDLLVNDVYTYANIDKNVPAESMAAFINKQLCPDFNWQDAEWLANEWGGELALKGVVRQDEAVKALDHGFTSLWVSNHGGRQLETSVPTIDALPGIRQAVGDDVEIILDGGVMRGTDIAKAIAMGADAVGIGKAYLYGLAAGGKPGVVKAIDILEDELERAMGPLGCRTVEDLKREGPSLIRKRGRDWYGGQQYHADLIKRGRGNPPPPVEKVATLA